MSSSVSIHSKGHDVHISTSWLREDKPFDPNNTRLLNITVDGHSITIFLERDDKICFMPEKY